MNALERAAIEKAGNDNGWEYVLRSDSAGVMLGSARHKGEMSISEGLGADKWHCDFSDALTLSELRRSFPDMDRDDGGFGTRTDSDLAHLLNRAAGLFMSLPDAAEKTFTKQVKEALSTYETAKTEVEAHVKRRIGQDVFRQALIDYWGGCAVTGIALPELLRASHARPWADCASDAQRLDVFNGLLLTANLDALFDRGLITFSDTGALMRSPQLPTSLANQLQLTDNITLRWVAPNHQPYLTWHREHVFRAAGKKATYAK